MFDPKDTAVRYSWSQPICGGCYRKVEPGRRPFSVQNSSPEKCCACGIITSEGIYYRIDPASVAFPTRLK